MNHSSLSVCGQYHKPKKISHQVEPTTLAQRPLEQLINCVNDVYTLDAALW